MFNDAFFVALGFVLFIALLGYLGVHRKLTKALDDRAVRIQAELDEAKRLRTEAAAVLASYEAKRMEAEAEAQAIVTQARAEAEALAKEAAERMAEFVARRTKQAEGKIAAGAVNASKIAAAAVTGDKIAGSAVASMPWERPEMMFVAWPVWEASAVFLTGPKRVDV